MFSILMLIDLLKQRNYLINYCHDDFVTVIFVCNKMITHFLLLEVLGKESKIVY